MGASSASGDDPGTVQLWVNLAWTMSDVALLLAESLSAMMRAQHPSADGGEAEDAEPLVPADHIRFTR